MILIPDLWPAARSANVLPLRGYCQTDGHSCGVSAGWATLKLLRRGQFRQFVKDCNAHPEWGTSTRKLSNALRRQGLRVATRELTMHTVRSAIADGHPLLTAIQMPGDDKELLHWVTIYGTRGRKILYAGRIFPLRSRTSMEWRKFARWCEDSCLVVSAAA